MSTNAIKGTLLGLGLNDKEIDIYLMLLSVGSSPASTLGNRTGISRSTAQYTCQQLVKKGLISVTRKDNTFLYVAEPPEKLLYLLDIQQQQLEEKKDQVHRIVGTLKSLLNPHSELPKVRFYEGEAGMRQLYEQILDTESPIDVLEGGGAMQRFVPDRIPLLLQKRVQHHVSKRVIRPSGEDGAGPADSQLCEVRHIPAADFPFTCDVKICKDTVSIFSFDQKAPAGVAIDHPDIAQNFRVLFGYLWKTLENGSSAGGSTAAIR
jgi:sugar-specific transcriptional regulator TrmB